MSIERQIEKLQEVNKRMRELKDKISRCDKAIKLVTRTYGGDVEKNPRVDIMIEDYDKFSDYDITASIKLTHLTEEETQTIVALINRVKDAAIAELSPLQKKYGK